MKHNKRLYEKLYNIFLLFLLIWVGLSLLGDVFAPDLEKWQILLTGGVVVTVFLCFSLTTGRQRIIPITITGVILLRLFFFSFAESTTYVERYFKWVTGWPIEEVFASFQYVNVCLAATIMIPAVLLLERTFKLRLTTALIIFIYLLFGVFTAIELENITICLCLLYIAFALTELLQMNSDRQKNIVYLLPFLGLYMIVLLVAPSKDEPYGWKTVKMIYYQISDFVVSVSQSISSSFEGSVEGFGMEVVGFSGDARVGGDLSSKARDELTITQINGKRMSIYLRGNVFDTFDGNAWQANLIENEYEYEYEYETDLIELLYAIDRHAPGLRADYINQSEIAISFTGLKSSYLFAPMKIVRIASDSKLDMRQYGSEFRFDSSKGRGTEYEITYYQMNLGQDYFKEMVVVENEYRYDTHQLDIEPHRYNLNRAITQESFASLEKRLKERSDQIHDQYTDRYPLSKEVQSFLYSTVWDAKSDYEKCKALEEMLAGRADIAFTYTKTPGELPEGKRFLDYFLLESHSGYCTYYATAFALLVRELGLPTRYVQGFLVYDENLGISPITVKSTTAHAWPEVYFEGVGWISFEPTPGFVNNRYQYWNPVVAVDMSGLSFVAPQMPELPESNVSDFELDAIEKEEKVSWFSFVLPLVFALIIALALFIALDYLVKKRRFQRYGPAQQFIEHVKTNLYILKLLGFKILPGETIHEFKERLVREKFKMSFTFLEQCEYFLYREKIADAAMIKLTLSDRETIFEAIKRMGKYRYYFIRFKLLIANK